MKFINLKLFSKIATMYDGICSLCCFHIEYLAMCIRNNKKYSLDRHSCDNVKVAQGTQDISDSSNRIFELINYADCPAKDGDVLFFVQ